MAAWLKLLSSHTFMLGRAKPSLALAFGNQAIRSNVGVWHHRQQCLLLGMHGFHSCMLGGGGSSLFMGLCPCVIEYNSFQKVGHVSLDPPKWTFWGDYIPAFRGAGPSNFLHALEIDQGLLAHTPNGDGVFKNFWGWTFKIWFKSQSLAPIYNFGTSGSNFTKVFYTMRWYNFWKACPQQNFGTKNGTIFDNIQLWSQMSSERIDMAKTPKAGDQLQPLWHWATNVGELWSVNQKIISTFIDPP